MVGFSYIYWLPNRLRVLCCLEIYISISPSLDHGPSVTGQEKWLSCQSEEFSTWGGAGIGGGVTGESTQKCVDQGFNSFSQSLHFNRDAPGILSNLPRVTIWKF